MLDAELLADVYINMTRGQEALLIDAGDAASNDAQQMVVQVDLSTFVLPVLPANAQELAAHAMKCLPNWTNPAAVKPSGARTKRLDLSCKCRWQSTSFLASTGQSAWFMP